MKLVLFTLSLFYSIMVVGCSSYQWTLTEGEHPHRFETKIVKNIDMPFLLYLPDNFTSVEQQWPLIVFLHGSGERGDDPEKLKVHSLPKIVAGKKDFPFIVVSPQCPAGKRWDVDALNAILDEVISQLPVDTTRIYLTGLSMGGLGTWKFAIAHPDRFAAIAPVCGWADPEDAQNLKDMPVWIFHGAKDDIVPPAESEFMAKRLKQYGNTEVKFTLYPDANHNAWDSTYANQQLYDWFLQHRRKN